MRQRCSRNSLILVQFTPQTLDCRVCRECESTVCFTARALVPRAASITSRRRSGYQRNGEPFGFEQFVIHCNDRSAFAILPRGQGLADAGAGELLSAWQPYSRAYGFLVGHARQFPPLAYRRIHLIVRRLDANSAGHG